MADRGTARILVFTPAGAPLFAFGGKGQGPGSFLAPVDVALGLDGSVFVVDEEREVVERYRIVRTTTGEQ